MRKGMALLVLCTIFCYTGYVNAQDYSISTKKKYEMMKTVERMDETQEKILKELEKLNDNFERVIKELSKTNGG